MTVAAATPQPRRAYDHRLREQVLRAGTRALMVLSPEKRHMSLHTLAMHAQRIGKVFASVSTCWLFQLHD